MTYTTNRSNKAFTLIELLIVVALIGLLAIIIMVAWRNHINKARDAQRKDDLHKISLAFEEYFSDHGCYPPADILNDCGGNELQPYLDKIPCDPISHEPYQYVVDPNSPACPKSFRVLTHLQNDSDPIIDTLNCRPNCGWGDALNYGVSSGNISLSTNPLASPSPQPSPSPSSVPIPSDHGSLACDPRGQCNVYSNPQGAGCPATFSDPNLCQQACDQSSSNWCRQ